MVRRAADWRTASQRGTHGFLLDAGKFGCGQLRAPRHRLCRFRPQQTAWPIHEPRAPPRRGLRRPQPLRRDDPGYRHGSCSEICYCGTVLPASRLWSIRRAELDTVLRSVNVPLAMANFARAVVLRGLRFEIRIGDLPATMLPRTSRQTDANQADCCTHREAVNVPFDHGR